MRFDVRVAVKWAAPLELLHVDMVLGSVGSTITGRSISTQSLGKLISRSVYHIAVFPCQFERLFNSSLRTFTCLK